VEPAGGVLIDGPARTRNCVDPWNMVFIRADGRVHLCCWAPAIGRLGERELEEILEGPEAREIRRGLLTGELTESCRNCPARAELSTERLHEKVEGLVLAKEISDAEELHGLRVEVRHWREEAHLLRVHGDELETERDALKGHTEAIESRLRGLEAHNAKVEAEMKHLRAHLANIEAEHEQLVGHTRNLERILRKIHGMAVYRFLGKTRAIFLPKRAER